MPPPHLTLAPFVGPDLAIPSGDPYPMASSHTCGLCDECPECFPLHVAHVKANEDYTAITDPAAWTAFSEQIPEAIQTYHDGANAQIQAALDWWVTQAQIMLSLESAIGEFWDDFGSVLDTGLDANHVSFTPRDGWIPISPTVGLTVWISSEEYADEVMRALQTSLLLDHLAELNADYNVAYGQVLEAQAAHNACKTFYEGEFPKAQTWADAQVQRWNDAAREYVDRANSTARAWNACTRACRNPVERPKMFAMLAAVGIAITGFGLITVGQPFDTGTPAVALQGAETPVEGSDDAADGAEPATEPAAPQDGETPQTPTDQPAQSPEPIVIQPPEMTSDEVMIDLVMLEMLGLAPESDYVSFLTEPSVADKFSLADTTPLIHSSFFAETLDEAGIDSELGPVRAVTNAGTAWLSFDSPMIDPQTALLEQFSPLADIAVPASRVSFSPSDGALLVGLTIDADLTDPATCQNTLFWFSLNILSPFGETPYEASSSFPGAYFDGGNYFPTIQLSECEGLSVLQRTDSSGTVENAVYDGPVSALFNVENGMTHVVLIAPSEYVPLDSSLYTVFFEADPTSDFSPETTRYQSFPDIFGPAAPITDGVTTEECDFTLSPIVEQTTPTTTTTSSTTTTSTTTTTTPSTGGGGGLAPGGGGTDAGGGDTGDTAGLPTGGTQDGGDFTPGEPDDTNVALVVTGIGLTAAGTGYAVSEAFTRRRKEEEEEGTGPPTAPAGAPPPDPSGVKPAEHATVTPDARRRQELADALASADADREAATQAAIEESAVRVEETREAHRAATARYNARKSAEANESMLESMHDWWTDKDDIEDSLLSKAASEVGATLDGYRRAVSEHIAIRLLTAPEDERSSILSELGGQRLAATRAAEALAETEIERVITRDEDDPERMAVISARRTQMQHAEVLGEAITIARTRLPVPIGRHNTYAILDALASSVDDTEEDRKWKKGVGGSEWWEDESEAHYRTREWLRDTKRDLAVDTFVALAEQGTIIDKRTGLPLADDLRKKVAMDRITWLSQYLQTRAWRDDDPRFTKSAELRERLATSYKAFSFLGYGHASTSEYFLATAAAIRSRQDDVNDWFLSDYLGFKDHLDAGDASGAGGNWRTYWAATDIGLGTKGRVLGFGDDDIDTIKDRISTMNDDADVAVLALDVAAKTIETARRENEPIKWPEGTAKLPNGDEIDMSHLRDLLISFGYLVEGRDGSIQYRMPSADNVVGRSTSIKLPGASWLDVVSARNAGEVLLSVAVPEIAAARLAAWTTRAGIAGVRAATAIRVLAGQGLGFAADVGFTWIRTPASKRDLARISGESLINTVAGLVGRFGADKLARAGVGRLATNPRVSKMLADPETKAMATKFLGEALGIPTDAVTQLVVQSAAGHDVSVDDLWSALLGAAMNRYLGRVATGTLEHPKLRSLLQPELHTEAMAVDKRLNDEASAAFEAAVKDAPLTAETGTGVFEALRRGDLTWEQLQRVFSIRGDDLAIVMGRVNDLRNELVASIGTRARKIAIDDITAHYDSLIADAPDQATADRLRTERRAELDLIGDPNSELRVAARFTSDALDVGALSRDELITRLRESDVAKGIDLESYNLIVLQDLAMRDLESRYVSAVRKEAGDEIAPGSAGPASDVDRSWSSEFLRRAARKVVLVEMTRGRLDDGTGPSTARAFDVNEYVNVMRRIPTMIDARSTYSGRTVEVITYGDGSTYELSHADAVEANSFASAMLHADGEYRTQFERNKLEGLTGAERARVDAMFTWARRELAKSDAELATYIARERERAGTDRPASEIELRARDDLYGDRMRQLETIGHQIDQATDPGRRAELMSEWELLMNRALRDGIETYSDMANLELIVIRMQSAKKADGSKYSPEDLMRSEEFKLGKERLKGIDAQQIRSMLNDQILMFMHHLHTLHSGHESPAKATRSLAKYAERALLALNLLGEFDPDTAGEYTQLFEATKALIEHKDNPKKLLETLENLRPEHRGDSAANLRWYLDQLELLPGMKGMTGQRPGSTPAAYNTTLAGREWLRGRESAAEVDQEGSWAAAVAIDLAFTLSELIDVEHELRTAVRLRGVLPGDRSRAFQLLEEFDEITYRSTSLVSSSFGGDLRRKLRADQHTWFLQIEEMRQRWEAAGRPEDDTVAAIIERLERRKQALSDARDRLTAELGNYTPVAGGN